MTTVTVATITDKVIEHDKVTYYEYRDDLDQLYVREPGVAYTYVAPNLTGWSVTDG